MEAAEAVRALLEITDCSTKLLAAADLHQPLWVCCGGGGSCSWDVGGGQMQSSGRHS